MASLYAFEPEQLSCCGWAGKALLQFSIPLPCQLSLRAQSELNVLLQNKSPEFVELYQSVHPVPNATAKVGERQSGLAGCTFIALQGVPPVPRGKAPGGKLLLNRQIAA